MTPPISGWMVVVEHDAEPSPWDENVAERPGTGRCTRSDGRQGDLVGLVPAGWRLVDVGCELTSGSGGRDRLYLLRADHVTCWLEHARPSRRWRVRGGRLELDIAETVMGAGHTGAPATLPSPRRTWPSLGPSSASAYRRQDRCHRQPDRCRAQRPRVIALG